MVPRVELVEFFHDGGDGVGVGELRAALLELGQGVLVAAYAHHAGQGVEDAGEGAGVVVEIDLGGNLLPYLVLEVARDGGVGDARVVDGRGRDGVEELDDAGDQVGQGVVKGERQLIVHKQPQRDLGGPPCPHGRGVAPRYLRGRERARLPSRAVVGVGGDGREAVQLVHRQEVLGAQPVFLEGGTAAKAPHTYSDRHRSSQRLTTPLETIVTAEGRIILKVQIVRI